MDDLRLFRRCAEEARGVEYGMGGGYCFETQFEVGGFFDMVSCLLVLGVDAVVEVVEADSYYWDHAVDRLRFRSYRDGRKEGSVETDQDGLKFFLQCLFPEGVISSIWRTAIQSGLVWIHEIVRVVLSMSFLSTIPIKRKKKST